MRAQDRRPGFTVGTPRSARTLKSSSAYSMALDRRSSRAKLAGMRIGLIGGTGKEGRGLALRWARAGHEILIGSRDAEKARARAS